MRFPIERFFVLELIIYGLSVTASHAGLLTAANKKILCQSASTKNNISFEHPYRAKDFAHRLGFVANPEKFAEFSNFRIYLNITTQAGRVLPSYSLFSTANDELLGIFIQENRGYTFLDFTPGRVFMALWPNEKEKVTGTLAGCLKSFDLPILHILPKAVNIGMFSIPVGLSERGSALPDFHELELVGFPGVYENSSRPFLYSYVLLNEAISAVRKGSPKRVLVLGGGNGYETIALLRKFPELKIDVTEIDPIALVNLKYNAELHGVGDRIRTFLSDLFSNVNGPYDLIIFAPPRAVNLQSLNELTRESHILYMKNNLHRFDPGGKLLNRLLGDFRAHLTVDGKFLLMSEAKMFVENAKNLNAKILDKGQWSKADPEAGDFAVFEIKP